MTKLRGEGELGFGSVRGLKSGMERMGNARELVALLMNERVRMRLREIRRINSRICIKREFCLSYLCMHQEWSGQRR